MPISLTCACGAKLEIDDAFAGKVIPCPDCQRPLTTVPAPPPPPVARPDQRTSMLAIFSVVVALAGAYTLIGGLIAAGLGFVALGQIERSEGKLAGRRLALAGLAVGLGFAALMGLLLVLRLPANVSGFLRAVEWAGRLDYSRTSIDKLIPQTPRAWGKLSIKASDADRRDDLLLYNPFEDSHFVMLKLVIDDRNLRDDTGRRQAALRALEDSDLVRVLLGQPPGRDGDGLHRPKPPSFTEVKETDYKDTGGWTQFYFSIRLGSQERTLLVRYKMLDEKFCVLCGVTRDSDFARLRPELETMMKSFQEN